MGGDRASIRPFGCAATRPDHRSSGRDPAAISHHLAAADYTTLTGDLIRCPVCGRTDAWLLLEGLARHRFVCEHPPVDLGLGWVRQIATVGLQQITRWEAVEAAA